MCSTPPDILHEERVLLMIQKEEIVIDKYEGPKEPATSSELVEDIGSSIRH